MPVAYLVSSHNGLMNSTHRGIKCITNYIPSPQCSHNLFTEIKRKYRNFGGTSAIGITENYPPTTFNADREENFANMTCPFHCLIRQICSTPYTLSTAIAELALWTCNLWCHLNLIWITERGLGMYIREDITHWNVKVARITALVVTGDVEGKLQRPRWRPEQPPWRPFRFCV